jgi:hypothetical protein
VLVLERTSCPLQFEERTATEGVTFGVRRTSLEEARRKEQQEGNVSVAGSEVFCNSVRIARAACLQFDKGANTRMGDNLIVFSLGVD